MFKQLDLRTADEPYKVVLARQLPRLIEIFDCINLRKFSRGNQFEVLKLSVLLAILA